ncbi:MAG: tetratricopeptide repeat protein [Elusimicrobia bacterium]|nr:tetratricopeptide repeat protein [Elusimicrobiota bacterium]
MQNPISRPFAQKTLAFALGLLALFLLAECGLRLYGFAATRLTLRRNLAAARQSGTLRVMCIGESMTYHGYPELLRQTLKQNCPGLDFEVIDAAIVGNNSSATLASLEKNIAAYSPHIVIAMLGCNDDVPSRIMKSPDYDTKWGRLLKLSRTYRFIHYLQELLLKHSVSGARAAWPRTPAHFLARAIIIPNLAFAEQDNSTHADFDSAMREGNYKLAQALAEKITAAEAHNPDAWVRMGLSHKAAGNYSAAQAAFFKTLQLDSNNYRAMRHIADIYIEHSLEPQKAQTFLDRATRLNPDDASAHLLRARLFMRMGQSADAAGHLKSAVKLAPSPQLWTELGNVQRDSGETTEAIASFRRAIQLNPNFGDAYATLGEIYSIQLKNEKIFSDIAHEMLAKNISPPSAYSLYAQFASELNMPDMAQKLLDRAHYLAPEDPEVNLAMGSFYLNIRHDADKARRHYRAALAANPESKAAHGGLLLAEEYLDMKPSSIVLGGAGHDVPVMLAENYREIKRILDRHRIQLLAMQYPMMKMEALKGIFDENSGVIFISNGNFAELVQANGYARYFNDMFAGEYGHCSREGNQLIADNAARAIISTLSPASCKLRR